MPTLVVDLDLQGDRDFEFIILCQEVYVTSVVAIVAFNHGDLFHEIVQLTAFRDLKLRSLSKIVNVYAIELRVEDDHEGGATLQICDSFIDDFDRFFIFRVDWISESR